MTGIIFAVLLTVMVIFFILQVKQASQSMIVEIVKAKSWENLFYERSRKEKLEDFLLDYKVKKLKCLI